MDILLWDYEKLIDIKFIRWLSRFFAQEKVTPIMNWVRSELKERGAKGLSLYFFRWAIGIIIVCFVIDVVIHWTKPEQRIQVKRFIAHFRIYFRRFVILVKKLYSKIIDKLKREPT